MMPDRDIWRSELESRLRGEPSAPAFRRICALLDAWPEGEGRDEAFALAARDLDGWPDPTRAVERPWWLTLGPGSPKATWGLVRDLAPDGDPAEEGDPNLADTVASLLGHAALASIRRLDLSFGVGADALVALARSGNLGQLRSLSLNALEPSRESVEELAHSGLLGRLQELELSGLDEDDVERLLLAADLSGLTALGVELAIPRLVDILGRAQLDRLTSLRLIGSPNPEDLEALGRWPNASRLVALRLPSHRGPADAVADVLASAGFSCLRTLDFRRSIEPGPELTVEGLSRIASALFFSGLSALVLSNHRFGDAGASILAKALPASLEVLEIRGAGIGPEGARALAARSGLDRLASIILGDNPIGDPGLAAIAAGRLLGPCRRLDLRSAELGPGGLGALADSAAAVRIADLRLARNPVGDEGAIALARAGFAPALVRLDLGSCGIGNRGASALVGPDSGLSLRLERLDLGGNLVLGGLKTKSLAASPRLSGLLSLDLSFTGIGKVGLRHLAESTTLTRLVELRLAGNAADFSSIRTLAASEIARTLEILDLDVYDQANRLKLLADAPDLRPEVRAGYAAALAELARPAPPPPKPNPHVAAAAYKALWDAPGNEGEQALRDQALMAMTSEDRQVAVAALNQLTFGSGYCRGPAISREEMARFVGLLLEVEAIAPVMRRAYRRYLEAQGEDA